MRTNIVIDARLMKEAMRLSRARTKKQLVDLALKSYINHLKRRKILDLFGEVKWEGDLKKMRK